MSARQIAEAEVADSRADEPLHFVTDFVKHPADLPIDPLS